jgi:hypothetical protein
MRIRALRDISSSFMFGDFSGMKHITFTALVLLAVSYAAHTQTPTEQLTEVAAELSAIRAITGEEPIWARHIDVSALVGSTREAVLEALGAPDSCLRELTDECRARDWWGYFFYYLPPGWRGGGPELWFEFDSAGVIEQAQWSVSR